MVLSIIYMNDHYVSYYAKSNMEDQWSSTLDELQYHTFNVQWYETYYD